MGAQFSLPLITVIPGQLIAAALWNNEWNNLNTNFVPAGMDSYSDSDSQMRIQTNPFPGSVTSHATSLGGEIERIRYVIAQILGNTYWYQPAASGNNLSNIFLTGEIRAFAGASIPSGFLLCDGSAVSRATYAILFTAIGTTWGSGDGATTFNVPDGRGRALLGAGTGSGLSARSLGQTGGEETHVLSVSELAAHNHDVTDTGHIHAVTDPGHHHDLASMNLTGTKNAVPLVDPNAHGLAATGGSSGDPYTNVTGDGQNSHQLVANNTTGVSVNNHTTGVTTNNNGSGTAHNNMQPWACVNYIIKT